MTTDISAFVEELRDGRWYPAGPTSLTPMQSPFGPRDDELDLTHPSIYLEQNYELYAILADVRNIRYAIEPIVPPRGFPANASAEAKLLQGQNWIWCSSWLLVSELLEFNWKKTITKEDGSIISYAELATRSADPFNAPLFSQTLPRLQRYGDPSRVRLLLFFF